MQDRYFEELKDDPDTEIRRQLAVNGYFLDEYTYDESWEVREAVAKRGHSIHILKKDTHKSVRNAAILFERNMLLKASLNSDSLRHNSKKR